MPYDTDYCDEYQKRLDARVFHSPEFTDEFEDLPEEERERLTDGEIRKYMVNPEAEDRLEAEWNAWQSEHLRCCTTKACHELYIRRRDGGMQK